jgi:hypothetical protein
MKFMHLTASLEASTGKAPEWVLHHGNAYEQRLFRNRYAQSFKKGLKSFNLFGKPLLTIFSAFFYMEFTNLYII